MNCFKKIFKTALYFLFAGILFLSMRSMTAKAAEALFLDIPLFTETQNMDMPRNSVSFWFLIPDGTLLNDECSIYLHITASDTLINERSSITLSVNDRIIKTFSILDITENETEYIQAAIPPELLRTENMNELKIITAQRSIEGDCADIDNPSNWINIHADSYLHLAVKSYGAPDLGQFYPYFYNSLTSQDKIRQEYILGSFSSSANLKSLLQIASAIGENAPYQSKLNSSVSEKQSHFSFANKIYAGISTEFDKLPLSVPASLSEDQGYLTVSGSGTDNSLLITGSSAEGLRKAVSFAADNHYLSQLDEKSQIITTTLPERKTLLSSGQEGFYTLEDLGFSDSNLAGAFHQKVSYTIRQPDGLQSGSNSYIELYFKHSRALVADHSLMTVSIDDIPQGSVKLSSSNADDGKLKIKIPQEALEKESFTLSVECYHYLGKVDCSKDYYDTAWTLIDKSSVLYLEPGDTGFRPTLSGFPFFPATQAYGLVTMVLPDNYEEAALNLAAMISTRAGQTSPAGLIWDVAVGSGSLTDNQKEQNLIFFGNLSEQTLPAEITAALTIIPTGDGTYLLRNDIGVTGETLKNKVILQSIRSPYDYDRRVYVILYDNGLSSEKAYEIIMHMLSDKAYLNNIGGHVALTADGEAFITFTMESDTGLTSNIPLSYERIVYLLERYTGISLTGLGIILILSILVLILMIRILKNKNRFSKAASKMRQENNTTTPLPAFSYPPDEEGGDEEEGLLTVKDILNMQKNEKRNSFDVDVTDEDDFDIDQP